MASSNLSRKAVVKSQWGLHARIAAMIARVAQTSESDVWLIKKGEKANAASTMDILTLACESSSIVTVQVEQSADMDILHQIVHLIESGSEGQ